MKLFALLTVTVLAVNAQATSIACSEILGNTKLTVDFNSKTPFLARKATITNTDGTIRVHDLPLILPTSACEMDIDFAKHCKGKEHRDAEKYTYNYACDRHNLKGSFTVRKTGWGYYICESDNWDDYVEFFGCSL